MLLWRELVEAFPEANGGADMAQPPKAGGRATKNTLLRYYQTTDDRASVGYLATRPGVRAPAEDRDHVLAIYEANTAAALAEGCRPTG